MWAHTDNRDCIPTLLRSCANLRGLSLKRAERYTLVFSPLRDYSFFFSTTLLQTMDIYVWISVYSVMYSWISSTVLSAPAGDTFAASTVNQGRHVRTKRCSCASFQDKECVYFCHLDIIWVNTPERVVSYGLGNAPRTRRALADSRAPMSVPRCQCVRENDNTCLKFCRPENRLRYETTDDAVIRSPEGDDGAAAQRKHKLAADTGRIKRLKNNSNKRAPPPALRAALKTRLLLEKWRVRQHHRARAWEGESVAS